MIYNNSVSQYLGQLSRFLSVLNVNYIMLIKYSSVEQI